MGPKLEKFQNETAAANMRHAAITGFHWKLKFEANQIYWLSLLKVAGYMTLYCSPDLPILPKKRNCHRSSIMELHIQIFDTQLCVFLSASSIRKSCPINTEDPSQKYTSDSCAGIHTYTLTIKYLL